MKTKSASLSILLYVTLLFLVYYIDITFFNINVIFYSALLDILVASIIGGLFLKYFPLFKIFNSFEKIQLIIIWLLVGYAFAISIPTVIDRSLSFYILEKLEQRGGGIKQNSFENIFKNEYVKEHRLIDVRLTEQIESGTIIIKDGCVKITNKGKNIVIISQYFRHNLLPKNRLLMGQYSDDLTDPFKKSPLNVDYLCD